MKTVILGLVIMFAVLGGIYVVTQQDEPTTTTPSVAPVGNLKIN